MRIVLLFVAVVISSQFLISCAEKNNSQSDSLTDFEPYVYKHSIEELHQNYSADLLKEASEDMQRILNSNKEGTYQGTVASINEHHTPEWYKDAKLGIFYDWGPYSIAGYGEKGWNRARYPDWYLSHMYNSYKEYHEKTWGSDFQRDDFIPLFTAENFDAKEIIDLVTRSGAKYLVPFNKHHDGYCLWDSKYTQRDVVDMFPGRDLSAELISECERAGLYHGFYYSVEDYEYPLIDEKGDLYVRYWSNNTVPNNSTAQNIKGEIQTEFIPGVHNRMISGKIPVTNFIDDYIVPKAIDYIDKYDPDILWFDGEWNRPADYYRTPEIVAYFYNQAEGRKQVASNDRLGFNTREHLGDFFTSETDEVVEKMNEPWEENRSMSESYGYNRTDSLGNYLTADELIEMLVRIVAKGGNLNLIVNPDGSGEIPEIQVNLLNELGDWLKINGEAIYGTRPFEKLVDNTQLGQPVWYTMSKDSTYAYAIVLDWPKSETFICPGANIKWETEVYMLGYDKPLEWVDTGTKSWGLSAKIPEEMLYDPTKRPSGHAWVLKFEYDRENEF